MASKVCPYLTDCSLHRSIGMAAALRVWQSFYCEGSFGRCERMKLRAAGGQVPERLLPNGRLLEASAVPSGDVPRDQAA
jgi:hypothetical protein